MKDYVKNRQTSYKYWDVNNLYGWVVTWNLPVGGFRWVENIS